MKKLWWVVLFLMAIVLVACGEDDSSTDADIKVGEVDTEAGNNTSGTVGTKTDDAEIVEVTIPFDYVALDSEDSLKEESEKRGIKDYTWNNDGSITYRIPKSEVDTVISNIKKQMDESITEYVSSDEFTLSGIDVKDEQYSHFGFTIPSKEEFEDSYDIFAVISMYVNAAHIQFIEGKTEEQIAVKGTFYDENKAELFTEEYPKDYEDE